MISITNLLSRVAKELKNKDLIDGVIGLIKENPNPSDAVVHAWAEKNEYAVDDVEAVIYSLATKYVNILTGGRSNEKKVSEKDFDPDQIKRGIKVELEHVTDRDTAKKIVLDHLAEHPKYYDFLEDMEKKFEENRC